MTYVIAEPCIDVKDKSCIEECPVNCIYEGDRMLYIHPDECVDCGACEPVCPVEAIFYEDDVPAQWKEFTATNAAFFTEGDDPLGSPGGAAKVGPQVRDTEYVANYIPTEDEAPEPLEVNSPPASPAVADDMSLPGLRADGLTSIPQSKPTAPRVFISHRQSDREFATALAIFFKSIGLDYYFDEQDEVLSSLVAQGHKYEESVVLSIDHGLDHSTHLLGLITAQTRGSWWVPYEIGGARGRGQATMYALFHDMIPDDVPEYVKISPIERSRSRLAKWAEELAGWPANLLGSQGASASPDQQRATIMHERNRAMAGLSSFMLE